LVERFEAALNGAFPTAISIYPLGVFELGPKVVAGAEGCRNAGDLQRHDPEDGAISAK